MTSDNVQGGTQHALHITPGGAMQASATAQFLHDVRQSTWLSTHLFLICGILASAAPLQHTNETLWSEAWAYHGLIPSNGVINSTVAAAYAKVAVKGFHGRIQYTLNSQAAVAEGACRITVLQALPAGVFADPYELANIARTPSKKNACYLQLSSYYVFGPTNVEKIEPECQSTLLSVSAEVQSQTSSSSSAHCKDLQLSVPLHARYPVPQSSNIDVGHVDSYHRYNMQDPSIILSCDDTTSGVLPPQHVLNVSSSDGAPSSQRLYQLGMVQSDLHWIVPAGLTKHTKVLQYLTLLVAFGSLCAVFVAIRLNRTKRHTKSKNV